MISCRLSLLWIVCLLFLSTYSVGQISYSFTYNAQQGNPGNINQEQDYITAGWSTVLSGGMAANQWSSNFSLPFDFSFYGQSVTQAKVSANGLLTFATNSNLIGGNNQLLPSSAIPPLTIAAYWENFTNNPPVSASDAVMTKVFGTAPNRQFWIRWTSFEWGPSSFVFVSIVLEEGTDKIYIVDQYSNPASANNVTATVGVQENTSQGVTASGINTTLKIAGANAFDNSFYTFSPFPIPPQDLKIVDIQTPTEKTCGLGMENIVLRFTNIGQLPASNADFSFSIDGGTPISESFTGSITPGDTLTYTFNTPADFATPGIYELSAWIKNPGDTIPGNDSVYQSVQHIKEISQFPYYEDFEDAAHGWRAVGAQSSWEYGIPVNPTILGGASGLRAWITNSTGNYLPFENSFVESPCFDFANAPVGLWLSMQVWWETQTPWDGATVQYTLDEGATWIQLGKAQPNWYSSSFIASLPGGSAEGWSGSSGAWTQVQVALPTALVGQSNVRFRVAFASNNSVEDEGIAFDDILIGVPPVFDLGEDRYFCEGDTLSIGLSDVTYSWSNGSTNDYVIVQSLGGTGFFDSVLTVLVSDALGLFRKDTVRMFLADPLAVELTGQTDVSCADLNDGSLDVTVTGGSQPLSFDWNGTLYAEDITDLSDGNYSLTVTDLNGCRIQSDSFHVNRPNPIQLSGIMKPVSCFGEDDGALSVITTGGVGNYSYLWSTGDTLPFLSDRTAGDYLFSVQDSNGCSKDSTLTVASPDSLQASLLGTIPASCPGTSDGMIELNITGGTRPYTRFAVALDGSGAFDIANLDSGLYQFEVVDSSGCQFIGDTVRIDQDNTPPVASFSFIKEDPQVSVSDSSVGANALLWDFGDGTTSDALNPIHTYDSNGSFMITQVVFSDCGTDTARSEVSISTVSLDQALDQIWNIFPNPHQGTFTISWQNLPSPPLAWEIWNLQGQKIGESIFVQSQAHSTISLPKEIYSGIYFFHLKGKEYTLQKKMMIK
ncbi:MAG: PKD domain-containing protein [Bacteroidota bacterium]